MRGGLAETVRLAASRAVLDEARRYLQARPGRAVVTSAGDLPARCIFHGITTGSRDGPGRASRDPIRQVLDSCLYQADCLHVRTMAVPLLDAATSGLDPASFLDAIFHVLVRSIASGWTGIDEARIVLPVDPTHQQR